MQEEKLELLEATSTPFAQDYEPTPPSPDLSPASFHRLHDQRLRRAALSRGTLALDRGAAGASSGASRAGTRADAAATAELEGESSEPGVVAL